jgi:hypothetical protein
MTETLARHLFDRLTISGRLDLGTWCDFKTEHGVEPQQIEPVLVQTLAHVLVLAGELQKEMDRLSRRTG